MPETTTERTCTTVVAITLPGLHPPLPDVQTCGLPMRRASEGLCETCGMSPDNGAVFFREHIDYYPGAGHPYREPWECPTHGLQREVAQ